MCAHLIMRGSKIKGYIKQEVNGLVGKLVVSGAVVGAGMLGFAAGWLKGHVEGAEGAAQQIKVLRGVAQCVGEDGCEWVLNQPSSTGERYVASIPGLRYYCPYVNTPILEKLTTVDIAGPLPRP